MHVVQFAFITLMLFGSMATSLNKLENKVQIHHRHVKCFHMVKRLQKLVKYIRRYSTKYASFLATSYLTFTNEPCQPWSYWTEFHEIFTRYAGIICAVNSPIEVAISYSVSEYKSDESGGFAIFGTKSVAMATSLDISKKEVQIDHLHPKSFHLM